MVGLLLRFGGLIKVKCMWGCREVIAHPKIQGRDLYNEQSDSSIQILF